MATFQRFGGNTMGAPSQAYFNQMMNHAPSTGGFSAYQSGGAGSAGSGTINALLGNQANQGASNGFAGMANMATSARAYHDAYAQAGAGGAGGAAGGAGGGAGVSGGPQGQGAPTLGAGSAGLPAQIQGLYDKANADNEARYQQGLGIIQGMGNTNMQREQRRTTGELATETARLYNMGLNNTTVLGTQRQGIMDRGAEREIAASDANKLQELNWVQGKSTTGPDLANWANVLSKANTQYAGGQGGYYGAGGGVSSGGGVDPSTGQRVTSTGAGGTSITTRQPGRSTGFGLVGGGGGGGASPNPGNMGYSSYAGAGGGGQPQMPGDLSGSVYGGPQMPGDLSGAVGGGGYAGAPTPGNLGGAVGGSGGPGVYVDQNTGQRWVQQPDGTWRQG